MHEKGIYIGEGRVHSKENTHTDFKGPRAYDRDVYHEHAEGKPWDFIIRVICSGCGKTLSRNDNIGRYAYCYQCRSVLWPETVNPYKAFRKRSYSRH